MERLGKFGMISLSTALIWLATLGVASLGISESLTNMAGLAAFGATVLLWLLLALDTVIDRLGKFGIATLSTLLIWFGMFMVRLLDDGSDITRLALLVSFGATVALWLVLGLEAIGQKPQERPQAWQKTKRGADDDARLALLLQMLDEDERQALRYRLMDQIGGDGEVVSLAALLGEDSSGRYQRR